MFSSPTPTAAQSKRDAVCPPPSRHRSASVALARFALLALFVVGALGLLAACGKAVGASAAGTTATTTHLSFDILPVHPGGPADNWPTYVATSPTALPADTVVTVTIRNFDIGDDALPAGSPFLHVQGTTGGMASADGKAYSALDPNHVSHTFTSTQLHLNVPIPGDPVGDANHVTVTFSFRTPAQAGSYSFQCFVPCGTGTSGFDGPMATMGYMRGNLTVVA